MNEAKMMAMMPCDTSYLESEVRPLGLLQIKPYSFYEQIIAEDENQIKFFMWMNGLYVLPTQELIDFLKKNILGKAIEIGAGNGAIGRSLGIPTTDSKLQDTEEIKKFYDEVGQPTIIYPPDIEMLDADQACRKYNPDTVIGAFITHKMLRGMDTGNPWGVEEEKIIRSCLRYINIGNLVTHGSKPILRRPHREQYFPWLITRSVNQSKNRIFIWDKI